MLTNYTAVYSVQRNDGRARVCATTTPDRGVPHTRVLLTCTAPVADQVAAALTWATEHSYTDLLRFARSHPGEVCHLRRAYLAAVEHGRRDEQTAHLDRLLAATEPLTAAQRRTVAEEVGRIYDGTEDILVPVDLLDEFEQLHWSSFANHWLESETDVDLIVEVLDGGHDALHEGLLWKLRVDEPDIEDLLEHYWLSPKVDVSVVRAWLRRHRPAVLTAADA